MKTEILNDLMRYKMSLYMYVDYLGDGFYPKALLSPTPLTFPDQDGNCLGVICHLGTGNKSYLSENIYQNCIFWSPNAEEQNYSPQEIYNWIMSWTYYKHKGVRYNIIHITM